MRFAISNADSIVLGYRVGILTVIDAIGSFLRYLGYVCAVVKIYRVAHIPAHGLYILLGSCNRNHSPG
jgi:hypothetical protein